MFQYLYHIPADIRQFATAIQTGFERGEQFNKFIQEPIIYPNRQNTSRDTLALLGRQIMFKHVIDGFSWIDGEPQVTAGSAIKEYLTSHPMFRKQLLGHGREFDDNNNSSKDIKSGIAGSFSEQRSGRAAFACVTNVDTRRAMIQS